MKNVVSFDTRINQPVGFKKQLTDHIGKGYIEPLYSIERADILFSSSQKIVSKNHTSLKQRRTRIVATLGPKISSTEMIRKLIEVGVDVFRLNFSHGTQKEHGEWIDRIKQVIEQMKSEGKLTRSVKILADIQGPKIRVGVFDNGSIELDKDKTVYFSREASSSNPDVIPVTFPEIIDALQAGQRILLDDGKQEIVVEKPVGPNSKLVQCRVVRGGILENNKGINLPGINLKIPALNDKDKSDIKFLLSKGVENIAISFIRTPNDMLEARKFVKSFGKKVNLIAKIEKPEAVESHNLKGIVTASNGVMVARGDLGIETNMVEVPRLQEAIIKEAKIQGKQVIVATQMLESMLKNTIPSRADVSDIADAAKDGADFCMLSGETSKGDYPVEAVQKMDEILRSYQPERSIRSNLKKTLDAFITLLRRIWFITTHLTSISHNRQEPL